jgi:diaminohydroxyphosphoribosylaminopyrimidine deaminase/5-amino-6-(5-phosphoribosylamino)uracil reductase
MQRAIDLAYSGLYSTSPNPRVGCVLVRDGEVIGEGYHVRAGEGHAEVNAIAQAIAQFGDAQAATAYVSLEPCSHHGKTPPCCDGLIDAGVSRVVAAMQDPNPQVAGNGFARLQAAGIEVEWGLLEQEAKQLNPGFIKRMATGMPWLRLKSAISLDGRTAMASGESKWITGAAARSDVQRLRARSCAIISGVDTVVTDNASLTVRAEQLGLPEAEAVLACERQPLRVVLDSNWRLPATATILQQPGTTLVVGVSEQPEAMAALRAAGAEVWVLPAVDGRVDLKALLAELAQRGCNEVMVEAGATLGAAFVGQGLVDELNIYMAPTLLGCRAKPMLALPFDTMAEQQRLVIEGITPVGDDWRIDARPVRDED